jgi:hypothetical protein
MNELLRMDPLAHPKADWSICLFTDALGIYGHPDPNPHPTKHKDVGLPME